MNDVNESFDATTETTAETKHDKWRRVANSRLATAIERLRMFHTLNGSGYEYKKSDVDALCGILTAEIDDIRNILMGDEKPKNIPQL